ncbi:MAG: response regulator [Burkholderiales bacterium]|nr:response regulator [Burkholderiales bacterium]MDE1927466.1 response regulator [Burkholderiales bacterium]MDE2159518.1 response regulator [Burkholderiales bacterium]MDE2505111.1 response regulator [Burkholderiales bacterium]
MEFEPQLPARSWRPWLVALGLWLALASVAALALWRMHRDAVEGQSREINLLSLALADEIARGLQGAETALRALGNELRDGRVPLRGAPATQALRTQADLMPLVREIWIVDDQGRLLAASDATPAPGLRLFAPAPAALAGDAVALSRPFADPATHRLLVAMALRFAGVHGRDPGWVIGAMPAPTLLGAFTAATPAPDARMAVFRSDGARLAGSIVAVPVLDEATIAARLAVRPSLDLRRFRDGSWHLVGLRSVPRFGVHMMLTRDLDAVLAPWRGAVQLSIFGAALLLAVMALAVYGVQRADRRHALAQHALAAQLARASKLEALGTLAGGVAHDFNNVLAAIVGYAEMAQDEAAPGSDQARYLERALQAALRGKALVERILAFSRGGARASTVFELQPVVEEVLGLLAATLRPGIVIERRFEAPGARLRGDPTQVFEAVANLCTNAMQAMPEGGMVTVHLERLRLGEARVLSHSRLQPGAWLVISVSDVGTGITDAVMERLFEPFFTTRAAASGTGLGLAVVHGVVAEFGGGIDVASRPGAGARFTLYLPESRDELAAAAPASAAPSGGGQRLLVVDDEPGLVALALEMLRGLGYDPVGMNDPAAALRALREAPAAWAAVITDEVMPGLTGTALTQALRPLAPRLPVLLVSGYGGAQLAQRAAAAGVTRVLAKPLQRAELAQALSQLL